MNKKIYNTQTLLGMLDMALDFFRENEICSLCPICNRRDNRCDDEVVCKNFLFEGLLKKFRDIK